MEGLMETRRNFRKNNRSKELINIHVNLETCRGLSNLLENAMILSSVRGIISCET
jgi:hypothetical protein